MKLLREENIGICLRIVDNVLDPPLLTKVL